MGKSDSEYRVPFNENFRPSYPQPYTIRNQMPSGMNEAFVEREIERIHRQSKHESRRTWKDTKFYEAKKWT